MGFKENKLRVKRKKMVEQFLKENGFDYLQEIPDAYNFDQKLSVVMLIFVEPYLELLEEAIPHIDYCNDRDLLKRIKAITESYYGN